MHHRLEEAKIKQYVSKYQNPDVTRRDVTAALGNYVGLSCKQEPFVFNDGRQVELLNLDGTVPVRYKGSVYNIPICIWLMDTHPNNAPMCYVKPTPDMQIKPSMFVDQSGKIYMPYLHEWSPSTSDLMGLIQVMVVTFGDQPPVYSKPRAGNAMSTPYPTTPFMPVPGGPGPGVGNTPYPVYPTSTPYPTPSSSSSYQTPYPPYPPSSGSSAGFPPYPPSYPSYPGSGYSGAQGYPMYPPSHPQGTPQTQSPAQSGGSGGTGTITEEHIRLSLLSAVEDKLRRRMTEQLSQTQAELETLNRTQRELNQGKERLDDILGRMEKEQVELDKNITILKDKEQELEKAIGRLSEQEPIDVDEAVTTTTPLYKQLLNAFAEEAAIEDTIYYMGEALRRGVIDLDAFLKQVRALSRKQFMLRALMHKCREKAGLAG